jgi:ATP-binding cassette subfamily C protein
LLLLLAAAAAAGLAVPFVLGRFVDLISTGTAQLLPMLGLTALMVAGVVAGAALSAAGIVLSSRLLESVLADLREQQVDVVLSLPQHRVEAAGSGDVVSRAVDDVAEVAEAIPEVVPAVGASMLAIAVTVIALTSLDPWFAIAMTVVLPVHAYAVWRYLREAPHAYARERAATSERAQSALDALYGVDTLRAYRLAGEHQRRIDASSWKVVHRVVATVVVQNAFFARLNLAEYLGMAGILCVGFVLTSTDQITVGAATTAMLLFLRLFGPINALLFVTDQLQSALASLQRIVGVIMSADPSEEPQAGTSQIAREGGVLLQNVSHRYGTGHPVLSDITLRVAPGEVLAIVGASGAGKSTLASIVAGIHTPAEGEVHRPTGDGDVVLVTQEVHVFNGSIRDNLRLAREHASDNELRAALASVGAASALVVLGSDLDTVVGRDGMSLDPATAQLIALARVQLADPRVVILDEATADAGSRLANRLDRAARTVLHHRTAIVITHRASQLEGVDRIAVLEAGRLVAEGTPAELTAAEGPYAHLFPSAEQGQSTSRWPAPQETGTEGSQQGDRSSTAM